MPNNQSLIDRLEDLKIPDFKSQVPDVLKGELSKVEVYLVDSLSVISQKQDWQMDKVIEQAYALKEIGLQCRATNGRVTKLESNIISVNDRLDKDERVVKIGRFVNTAVTNKYVLVGLLFAFVLSVHVISLIPVGPVLKALIGIFTGI